MQINTMGAERQTPREEQEQFAREFAKSEGFRAGRNGYANGLNPYRSDDPLYEAWRWSWQQGAAARARAALEAARAREPEFLIQHEGTPAHLVSLSVLVHDNPDDESVIEWATHARVLDRMSVGGGGAPECMLRRVA